MYNKSQLKQEKMSKAKSKSPLGLYDLENNLVKTFTNQLELAARGQLSEGTPSLKEIEFGDRVFFLSNFFVEHKKTSHGFYTSRHEV
jgi:hypothetical protein